MNGRTLRCCTGDMANPLNLDPDERQEIDQLAEISLTSLAFVFLGLLVAEYAFALTPEQARWVELAGWVIWLAFALDFIVRFALADAKVAYVRRNWLTVLALVLPAFRVFRAARAVRAVRSLRLARLVTGTNRGANALRRVVGFAGAGYVFVLTVVVWVLGSAGIIYLERGQPGATIGTFPQALWWTATSLIQQGSEQNPVTAEGRVLAVLIMIFALAISGYITAVLAAYLLGRRQENERNAGTRERREHVPSYVPPRAEGGTSRFTYGRHNSPSEAQTRSAQIDSNHPVRVD
jgi:voltage-gated potassium channel